MKHLLHSLHLALLHLTRALHPAPCLPAGVFVGRALTHDSAAKASKAPSLAQQEKEWLRESCLEPKDIPGELLPAENARSITFFDIDGKALPGATLKRLFIPTTGFLAGAEPAHKYRHPEGEPPHLYFPQSLPTNRRTWAKDAKQCKIFGEGSKKAALLSKEGFPAIGIEGCWGFKSKKHGYMLLPEFNDFDFADCDVYWVPDHDRNPKSVRDVLRASNALALLLQERGARFHVVWLDLLEGKDKVGVDDFFHHYSRGGKDRRAARNAFKEKLAATPEWKDFEITDPGNAKRWVDMYGSRFHYVGGLRGRWLVYRDGRWEDDELLERQETCKQMFNDMLDDARDMGNSERFSLLNRHVNTQRVKNVPELAKSDPAIIISPNVLDQHPYLVNCQNGTIEMPLPKGKDSTLRFREHSPYDLLTKAAAVNWNEKAACPAFKQALDFWTHGDPDLQRTIQQLLGVSLTGDTSIQSFILLYGPGASGKSTLIEIVKEILANYAIALPSETLLLRRYGTQEERKLAPLPGARFATASETETGGVMDENLMKLLTGEDTVAGRRLYEETFNFKPEAKIWLRTNNKPEIRSTGNDVWRRIIALPFGQTVSEKMKDPHLKQKLRQEREGIFAWMVRGYLDYAQYGLFIAPVAEEAKKQYQKEQDVLERFFEAQCEFKSTHNIGKEELYADFKQWCETQHIRVVPAIAKFKAEIESRFSDRIIEKRISLNGKQERRWFGVDTKLRQFRKWQK